MSENTPPPDDGTEFIAAASDGAYTLVVADFADTATAWSAYEGSRPRRTDERSRSRASWW